MRWAVSITTIFVIITLMITAHATLDASQDIYNGKIISVVEVNDQDAQTENSSVDGKKAIENRILGDRRNRVIQENDVPQWKKENNPRKYRKVSKDQVKAVIDKSPISLSKLQSSIDQGASDGNSNQSADKENFLPAYAKLLIPNLRSELRKLKEKKQMDEKKEQQRLKKEEELLRKKEIQQPRMVRVSSNGKSQFSRRKPVQPPVKTIVQPKVEVAPKVDLPIDTESMSDVLDLLGSLANFANQN